MNWKVLLALAVVVFMACAAGRELCSKWRCFPLCLFMGGISLGLAVVVALCSKK